MRSSPPSRLAAFAVAAILALGLPGPATAAATWTVRPGGYFTASGGVSLEDTTSGATISCQSQVHGRLGSGSGLRGAGLGSLTSLGLSGCHGPGGLAFTVALRRLPWTLNALSYSAGTMTGSITGIDLTLTAANCTATVAGRAASKPGMEEFRYTNRTGQLKLLAATSTLHFWDVSGCLSQFSNGDGAALAGTLTVKPRQTITSP